VDEKRRVSVSDEGGRDVILSSSRRMMKKPPIIESPFLIPDRWSPITGNRSLASRGRAGRFWGSPSWKPF